MWLSLDADDNDPTRFLSYLIAAVQTVHPSLGQTALALLQSPQSPPPRVVMTMLLNELSLVSPAVVLVLDDYHNISARPIHDALTLLLDHPAPALRLILLTRTDPPLPLGRLRASDQLTEIRAPDLRW